MILYADAVFQNRALSLDLGQRVADLPEGTTDVRVTFGSTQIRCR